MDDGWLESRLAGNGTADRGGFTEAYLTEEGFTQEARKREVRVYMCCCIFLAVLGGFTEACLTEEGFTQEARKREVSSMAVLQPNFAGLAARAAGQRLCPQTHAQSAPTHSPTPLAQPAPLCVLQNELPEQLANSSNTIAWWQGRQAEVQERLSKRRAAPSPKPAEQVGRCF